MSLVLFITENKNAVRVLDDLLKEYLVDIDVILAPNADSAINSVSSGQRLSTIIIDQTTEKEIANIEILRKKDVNFPIIAITDSKNDNEQILTQAGATQVIEKPFFFKDFEPFLYALVNEYESCDKGCFSINEIDFYPANRVLYHPKDNKTVNLTEKETDILKYMYQRRGKYINKDLLLKDIWQYNTQDISTHTLETHIYRLRTKFEELTKKEIISTDSGGYKLN